MTEKLYYNDPYTLEFKADIIEVKPFEHNFAIILDKTFFYPTSGGQPNDTGLLNNLKVVDVIDQDGQVLHITESAPEKGPVSGKIDYLRRLEHLQHHTGQHLLSQSFIRVASAPTISFHLGSEFATIEIVTKELSAETVIEVEELANDLIYQNRKINILYAAPDEVNELKLRKKPKKQCASGDIRVIEIEDFDLSPCGGTHALYTGEIGLIKIISWEKYKGNVKVEFSCGHRALNDYRFKNQAIKHIAAKFSAKDKKIEEIIYKSIEDSKNLQKQLNLANNKLAVFIAQDLLNNSQDFKQYKLIAKVFEDTDINTLKKIGQELNAKPDYIVLLLSEFEKRTNLLFCCSENISLNLNNISAPIFKMINGKGGGKAGFIQGSGEQANLDELLGQAKKLLAELI
jgi:alanyl-tRNA synthetase